MPSRREFLGVAAATVGTAAAAALERRAVANGEAARSSDAEARDPGELLRLLGPDAVREIGRAYRASTPAEAGAEALVAALAAARATPAEDFAAGRTVVVRGWVLSATEARRCALYSLGDA